MSPKTLKTHMKRKTTQAKRPEEVLIGTLEVETMIEVHFP